MSVLRGMAQACEELKVNCAGFNEYPVEIQLQLSRVGWYQWYVVNKIYLEIHYA